MESQRVTVTMKKSSISCMFRLPPVASGTGSAQAEFRSPYVVSCCGSFLCSRQSPFHPCSQLPTLNGKHERLERLDKTGWVWGESARDAGLMLVTTSGHSPVLGCRSEEKTSELQSRENLVFSLLLEKKNEKCSN